MLATLPSRPADTDTGSKSGDHWHGHVMSTRLARGQTQDDRAKRTPEAVFTTATAAAAWMEEQVRRLTGAAPEADWSDTRAVWREYLCQAVTLESGAADTSVIVDVVRKAGCACRPAGRRAAKAVTAS